MTPRHRVHKITIKYSVLYRKRVRQGYPTNQDAELSILFVRLRPETRAWLVSMLMHNAQPQKKTTANTMRCRVLYDSSQVAASHALPSSPSNT